MRFVPADRAAAMKGTTATADLQQLRGVHAQALLRVRRAQRLRDDFIHQLLRRSSVIADVESVSADLDAALVACDEALLPLVAANDPQLTVFCAGSQVITDDYVGRLADALSPMRWRMFREGTHNTHVQYVGLSEYTSEGSGMLTDAGAALLQAAIVDGCGVVSVSIEGSSVTPHAQASLFRQCSALACRRLAADDALLKHIDWCQCTDVPNECWGPALNSLAEALPRNTKLRSIDLPTASAWGHHAGLRTALQQCKVWEVGHCPGGDLEAVGIPEVERQQLIDAVTANMVALLATNEPDPACDLYENEGKDPYLWYDKADSQSVVWDLSKLGDVADALRDTTCISRIDVDLNSEPLDPDVAADVVRRLKNAIPSTRLTSLTGFQSLGISLAEVAQLDRLVIENGVRLTAADAPTHRSLGYNGMSIGDDEINSLVPALMNNRHLRSIDLSYVSGGEVSAHTASQFVAALRTSCVEKVFDHEDQDALEFEESNETAQTHLEIFPRDVHAELLVACRLNAYRRHARIAYRPRQRMLLAAIGNRFSELRLCADLLREICSHLEMSLLCPMHAREAWQRWEFTPANGAGMKSSHHGMRAFIGVLAPEMEWREWETFRWEEFQLADVTGTQDAKRQRTR
jgi:hypothetical protein